MWNSGSTSADLAKGKKFLKKLLYVQHVDKEKDTASEIPEQSLHEYLIADRKEFSSPDFREYLRNPRGNLGILKSSSLEDVIVHATVYSNPLPIPLKSGITIHAFVVFKMENETNSKVTWWSLEKNGKYIVLQQSPEKDGVTQKLYDAEKKELVKRLEPVKTQKSARGNFKNLKCLLQAIWDTSQISNPYHLLISNCQNFASFVFEKSTFHEEKWSTPISAVVDRIGSSKKTSRSEIDFSILEDNKCVFYKAMIEGRREDFEDFANYLTRESLNSVDSQGYTLLEWATVFSTSDWPIDRFLKERGAEIVADEGMFRRNVFFIALKYLHPDKESKNPSLIFDGIDIKGVNSTGDTALQLALAMGKWETAKKIVSQLKDYDVNTINSSGDTPLSLAIRHKCEFALVKKILARTNSDTVNYRNDYGNTALHFAILCESKTVVDQLLKRKDVDVNVKNNDNHTALHFAAKWTDFPVDLLRIILEKSSNVNAQDGDGRTALHFAIMMKSKMMLEELLTRKDVDVNRKNKDSQTALHFASFWKDIPIHSFRIILENSNDVNAQDDGYGRTALHLAILYQSKTVVKELLKHKEVDVNLKDKDNQTALHYATLWTNIPIDLFRKILKSSTDVNVQERDGRTALQCAIIEGNETVAEELLKCKDVDVNLKDKNNQTALHLVSFSTTDMPLDLFRIILEQSTDVNARDKGGHTALHLATIKQSRTLVEELLKHKDVNVNLKNNDNCTALHFASLWTNIPICLLSEMLGKSTDDNEQDKDGHTALHHAIVYKSETAVNELLKRNVDVNLKDNGNITALHFAAMWKNIPTDLFRIILKRSTDVNAQDKDGHTALHVAITYESENAITELLKRKEVDVDLKNNDNQTALHLASLWKDMPVDLFRIMLEKSTVANAQNENEESSLHHSAEINESETATETLLKQEVLNVNDIHKAVHLVCSSGVPIDAFRIILGYLTNVNVQNEDGDTALHCAFRYMFSTVINELLKLKDVNVNIKNNEKRTALHFASIWKDTPIDLFRIILGKSTDVNAQDEYGCTALHFVLTNETETAAEELLKRKDVNVNLKDVDSQTALHLASVWKNIPIDLFRIILGQSTDVNAQAKHGYTALHLAMFTQSTTALNELLKHKDVDVNLKNNFNRTALDYASVWKNIPNDLFRIVLEKSSEVNKTEALLYKSKLCSSKKPS